MALLERTEGEREPFAAWLDDEPLSRRGKAVLLATAGALALVWLPGLGGAFVGAAASGRQSPLANPWVYAGHLSADAVMGFAVGALSGMAARRFRWVVGPGLMAALACVHVLLALPYLGQPVPGLAGAGAAQLSLQLDLAKAGYVGGVLVFAALGGLLSPTIFRRVRVSAGISTALAWVGGRVIAVLVLWCSLLVDYPGTSYMTWSVTDVVVRGCENLPYFAGGVWMGWALRGRPWVGAVAMGAMAALPAVRGHFRFVTPEFGSAALLYTCLILTRGVVAGVGAWLGGVLAGVRSRRELLRPGIVIIAAGLVAVVVGSLAKSRPRGISSGVQPLVENGEIVLLTKGEAIGALIPTKQTVDPERVSYEWHYRTDGRGTFGAQEAQDYRSGEVKDATGISFGPFSLSWSGRNDGSGYLYYQHFPGSPVGEDDIRICVTHERDLGQLDAFDGRWVFKGSPSDAGMRLTRVSTGNAIPAP